MGLQPSKGGEGMDPVQISINLENAEKLRGLLYKHKQLLNNLFDNLMEIEAARLKLECEINGPALEPQARQGSDVV